MKRILSTKKLSADQRALLVNSGLTCVEYDAISIELLDFDMPDVIENAIFTSQNAVRSFLKNKSENTTIGRIFCVGEKTARILTKNGKNVTKIEENASKLATFITNSIKNEQFYFFAGNLQKDDITAIEKTTKNRIFELKTYKTRLKPTKFDQIFDGILFFSPSGVQSFTMENKLDLTPAFCIGKTTASEAKKHTDKVLVANNTSVESVIREAVKTLEADDKE